MLSPLKPTEIYEVLYLYDFGPAFPTSYSGFRAEMTMTMVWQTIKVMSKQHQFNLREHLSNNITDLYRNKSRFIVVILLQESYNHLSLERRSQVMSTFTSLPSSSSRCQDKTKSEECLVLSCQVQKLTLLH